MGFVLSRFRRKKTTTDQLEEIENKIRSIEKFHKETEQQFRRVAGKLIVSSISIYLIALVGYYYYYSPETFRENITTFLPLLVFPIIIIFSRKLVSWYYRRKLSKNEANLKMLKATKKKILEEVMDKEIYKVAKEILEKYAPDQLNKDTGKIVPTNTMKSIMPAPPTSGSIARHRLISSTPAEHKFNPARRPETAFQAVPNMAAQAQPRLSLPRPILQRDRGAFDKLVDMIIGDGPSNRYALICRVCSSHNGMALKNEFEYLAFRCAYCLQWNPARKQRPHAPNLVSDHGSQDESDAYNSEPEPSSDVNDAILSGSSSEISKMKNNSADSAASQDSTDTTDKSNDGPSKEELTDDAANETKLVKESTSSKTVNLDEIDVPVSTGYMDLTELHSALSELDNSSSAMDMDLTESHSTVSETDNSSSLVESSHVADSASHLVANTASDR